MDEQINAQKPLSQTCLGDINANKKTEGNINQWRPSKIEWYLLSEKTAEPNIKKQEVSQGRTNPLRLRVLETPTLYSLKKPIGSQSLSILSAQTSYNCNNPSRDPISKGGED
ncbi:hypothetical protein P3339_05615 [Microbulbifer sp. MLAF003]|uniref:hypothetical protein n=1 Tax=Microbulbifer sp. MLAF003 TaxID=3032582 RepID=UPI0024AD8F1D|nr:hypothetical protein [Microbulbifer sp. MLAF003]WHI52264.1 hypothetical protein P3339_05615 [Microbulbifer sp. MLAF003]